MALAAEPDQRGGLSGIIHVGAHYGEEIASYLTARRVPVLAFEPQPEVVTHLTMAYASEIQRKEVQVCGFALGDKTGPASIFVAQGGDGRWDTPTASLLGRVLPDAARRLGWEGWLRPYNSQLIEVYCWRFDDWVEALSIFGSPINLDLYSDLVIDVQGYELPVLRGFGEHLQRFPYLCIECSEQEVYAGEATAESVAAFLAEQGFRQMTATQPHGDIVFERA